MTQTTPPKYLVLYADDDADDINLVENAFATATNNVELVIAFDGEDALDYLESLTEVDPDPCLIILDVNMPKLNGKETLFRIRQIDRFKKTPVVLFTTSSLEGDKKFAARHEAGFVTKPLNSHQMQLITEQFLEHCSDEVKKEIRKLTN
jgi:CheY-like chemotaxis protein